MSVITKALIITKRSLADNIYYLKTERPKDFNFFPGQFARLGLSTLNESDPVIWRAQTIACGAESEELHFYVVYLKGEKFSDALKKNHAGSAITFDKRAYGYFTLDRFEPTGDLWLFFTGTGIAPYLAMLNNERIWKSFKNISLIGAFREKSQNVYNEQILSKVTSSYKAIHQNRFSYIPIFTREQTDSRCIINNKILDTTIKNKHFEDLLRSGEIENILSISIANNKSKVMLAGNPQMIMNTRDYLKKLGLQMSRRNNLAQIAVENYW